MKDTRIVLPLAQTVFLPQNAMGVRYIDRVRTKVYVDNLTRRKKGPVCLQGFYELDLEYHGLEGQRLYKHRVMLPLRAELPGDWPSAGLDYEASELHCIITKPMIRILSPYVLEFNAGLAVEYVGDRLCTPEQPDEEELAEERRHLDSKFGRAMIGSEARQDNAANIIDADKDADTEEIRRNIQREIRAEIAEDLRAELADKAEEQIEDRLEDKMNKLSWWKDGSRETAAEAEPESDKHSLPVWSSKSEESQSVAAEPEAESDKHSLPVWSPKSGESQSVAAEPEAESDKHSLPVWSPKSEESQSVAAEPEPESDKHSLPVWSPKSEESQSVAAEPGPDKHSLPVWSPKSGESQNVAAEPEPDKHSLPVWSPKSGESQNVEVVSRKFQPEKKNERSEPNLNRFRSILSTAAIARLQARGESLTAAAETEDMNRQVREVIKDRVKREQDQGRISAQSSEHGGEERESMNRAKQEFIQETAADMPEQTAAVAAAAAGDNGDDNIIEDKIVEDNITENNIIEETGITEAVAATAPEPSPEENVAEAAAEAIDAAEATEAAEAAVSEEMPSEEAAAETVVEAASAEVVAAAEPEPMPAANVGRGVNGVNAAGVRMRVGVHEGSELSAKKPVGGYSLKYYVVKPGDDPMSIALKHNVSLEKLRACNASQLAGEIVAGTVLKIPV